MEVVMSEVEVDGAVAPSMVVVDERGEPWTAGSSGS